MPTVNLESVRKVLILRTDHLGDLLLTTPLIRNLRNALPSRHFTLVCSPANADALAGWDGIDEILLFDPKWTVLQKIHFWQRLRKQRYDLCLVLSPRTGAYLTGWFSGATWRAGIVYHRRLLARLFAPVWLTHPLVLALDPLIEQGLPVPHEVEQLNSLLTELKIQGVPGPLEISFTAADKEWARLFLTSQAQDIRPWIGIHGASKWLSGGWTSDDFFSLLHQLSMDYPTHSFLLTFGPGDRLIGSQIKALIQQHPLPHVTIAEELPVARWAALFSCCEAVISPDTGSLHVAVAVGRPVVALYEDAVFVHCSSQWAPWQVPHVIVRRKGLTETKAALVNGLSTLIARGSENGRSS